MKPKIVHFVVAQLLITIAYVRGLAVLALLAWPYHKRMRIMPTRKQAGTLSYALCGRRNHSDSRPANITFINCICVCTITAPHRTRITHQRAEMLLLILLCCPQLVYDAVWLLRACARIRAGIHAPAAAGSRCKSFAAPSPVMAQCLVRGVDVGDGVDNGFCIHVSNIC